MVWSVYSGTPPEGAMTSPEVYLDSSEADWPSAGVKRGREQHERPKRLRRTRGAVTCADRSMGVTRYEAPWISKLATNFHAAHSPSTELSSVTIPTLIGLPESLLWARRCVPSLPSMCAPLVLNTPGVRSARQTLLRYDRSSLVGVSECCQPSPVIAGRTSSPQSRRQGRGAPQHLRPCRIGNINSNGNTETTHNTHLTQTDERRVS